MWRVLFLAGAVLATCRGFADAEDDAPAKTVLMIHPTKEPIPALRYGLIPPVREVIPGNAALFYHRAIESLLHDSYSRRIRDAKASRPAEAGASDDPVMDWLAMPPSQLPRDAVRRLIEEQGRIVREVDLGARRDHCDWEFDRRDEGYNLSLDEVQETRRLGRLVALRARFDIAEGRIDAALHSIQTGFALARHVGEGRFYIQSMIAASIAHPMVDALEQLVQSPRRPNLYWALAALPRPFIDLRAANEGERFLLEREFPRLRDVRRSVWSLEEARAFGDELERKGDLLFNRWRPPKSRLGQPAFADLAEHLAVVVAVARAYPEATRTLIASGEPADRVEAMPAVQVVAAFSYRIYEQRRDDLFKWMNLPYSEAYPGVTEAERKIYADPSVGFPFFSVLPSVGAVLGAPVGVDRRLAAIQTVEAVACHAAAHDGALPRSLEELTETPAALDPATNRPFAYTADGARFTVSAPPLPGYERVSRFAVHYEVELAR